MPEAARHAYPSIPHFRAMVVTSSLVRAVPGHQSGEFDDKTYAGFTGSHNAVSQIVSELGACKHQTAVSSLIWLQSVKVLLLGPS